MEVHFENLRGGGNPPMYFTATWSPFPVHQIPLECLEHQEKTKKGIKMKFSHNVAKGYRYNCWKFQIRTIFQSKDMIQQVELSEWPSYVNFQICNIVIVIIDIDQKEVV